MAYAGNRQRGALSDQVGTWLRGVVDRANGFSGMPISAEWECQGNRQDNIPRKWPDGARNTIAADGRTCTSSVPMLWLMVSAVHTVFGLPYVLNCALKGGLAERAPYRVLCLFCLKVSWYASRGWLFRLPANCVMPLVCHTQLRVWQSLKHFRNSHAILHVLTPSCVHL